MLYQERIAKPRALASNEQIYQVWRWNSTKQELVLLEERKNKYDRPVGASVFQTWYCGERKGEKDKIEIDMIVCASPEDMEETIDGFTTKLYAATFRITETAFAGERSWMPIDPSEESFLVMFTKANVFIRLYVRLKDKNKNEQLCNEIANKIENKIVF